MLPAIAGILLILGLLALTAFYVGKEHLHDVEEGDAAPLPPFPGIHFR
jgi:hypothetical protein